MASFLGRGGNTITAKSKDILVFNRTHTSPTVADAYLKYLKFYRDACRRMPFILASNNLPHIVHPTQAKLNLGSNLRQNTFLRNKAVLDRLTVSGYEWLYETSWMYNHYHNFAAYILTPHQDNSGYSYLDEKRYGGCSTFLKNFFTGVDRPNY